MKRAVFFLMLLAAADAAAQMRFEGFERRNPWNTGVHAAGIRQDTLNRSYAEAYFTKENGGLVDPSSSDDSWNAGATTRSIRHFEKVSFAGGFSYDYFDGRNMCGSMLTEPGAWPVDILEFTPGRKVRETYAFTGSLAARLGRRWTGGLRADFAARNYAKRKDLRHKNTRLDFEFAPGAMYHDGGFAVGAAYLVGINTERVEAEEVGARAGSYEAFFDRGLRYGSLALWESNDLHLTTSGVSGFPLREYIQGASVALQFGPLYADVAYRHRDGETGERGIRWHDFAGDEVKARAVLSLRSREWRHVVRASFDWRSDDNRETVLTYETVNGVSTPHEHGSVPVFGRKQADAGLEYEVVAAGTELRVGGTYSQQERESTLMYPFVEGQRLHVARIWADWLQRFGRWEVNLGADFRKGGFSEYEERYETGMTPGEYPARLTEWYDCENEYLTASRVGLTAGLRRNIGRFYVDASVRWEHGFDLRRVAQPNRVRATLGVGYNF